MAIATHEPGDWNTILSTTFHNYRKTLTDNVWNARPLLNFYMSKGRVRTLSGGISIVEPIIATEGLTQAYDEWEAVLVNSVDTATAAQYAWKQLAATIIISGLEEAQNNSKEMIVNLLEAKIMQAEDTLKTRVNRMLFGTYAGSDAAKGFTGLPVLVDDTVACGGITPNGTTENWWKSQSIDGGAVDGAGLEALLRNAYNKASDAGNDRVDALFTNAYGFGFYESTLTPQVRYTDTAKANLGFQNLMFKNVPMFWDFDCSGGTEGTVSDVSASFYGLNSKYIGVAIHSDRNFKQSSFTDNLSGSVTQGGGSATASALDARVSFITTYGEHTTRNRRRNFKITGVTEAA